MVIATCFHYLESCHVSSDAELDWCNSQDRQADDAKSARYSARAGACRRSDDLVMMKSLQLPFMALGQFAVGQFAVGTIHRKK